MSSPLASPVLLLWSERVSGTLRKVSVTGGGYFTMRSPSLKAQRALASSHLKRTIFVFHLQRPCSKIWEAGTWRQTQKSQCLQFRNEQITAIRSTTTTISNDNCHHTDKEHIDLESAALWCLSVGFLPICFKNRVRCHGY